MLSYKANQLIYNRYMPFYRSLPKLKNLNRRCLIISLNFAAKYCGHAFKICIIMETIWRKNQIPNELYIITLFGPICNFTLLDINIGIILLLLCEYILTNNMYNNTLTYKTGKLFFIKISLQY